MPNKMRMEQQAEAIQEVVSEQHSSQQNNSFELLMSQINIAGPEDLNNTFTQQWQNAAMDKQLISLLLCEIDFYQEYVECYGVQGASFMLISVALTLKSICDIHGCFLTHNEQRGFTILVKGGSFQEVQTIADSLCAAVKKSKTEHKHSKVNGFITITIGASSTYPTTQADLKESANNSVTSAKTAGGNRVSDVESLQKIDNSAPRNRINTSTVANNIDTNRQKELAEKQKINAQQLDFFAEPEQQTSANGGKTYRGQIINQDPEQQQIDALKSHNSALNNGKAPRSTEKKKPAVRMYRGQVVTR